jgi:hypothetical protein
LSNIAQLSIFDLPPAPKALAPDTKNPAPETFRPGTRIRITQAGPPLEHLNGRVGEVVSAMQGLALVKIEGIATAMMLRVEALETYSEIRQSVDAFDDVAQPIIVGSIVE